MTITLNGTTGITDVNGTAAAPAITGTDTDSGMYFGTNTVSLATGGTAAVIVDSSQNVGVSTTPSSWGSPFKSVDVTGYASFAGTTTGAALVLQNAYYNGTNYIYKNTDFALRYSLGSGAHTFSYAASGTAGATVTFTEAARIDTSGNFLVNSTTTIGNAKALFKSTTAGGWASFHRGNDYAKATMLDVSSGYVDFFYYNGSTGSYAGYISIAAGVTSYVTSSDVRLKENIVDAPNTLESIKNIQVRSFDWKNGVGSVEFGVVAQELYPFAPESVTVGKDKENGEMEIAWGFDGSKLVPRLVKAIQEQQTLITSLTDRIAALEAR